MNNFIKGIFVILLGVGISACNSDSGSQETESQETGSQETKSQEEESQEAESQEDDSQTTSGDVQAPSLVSSLAEQTVLLATQPVTLEFSESIDTETFKLFADNVELASFSAIWNDDETTVTLTPETHWPSGDSAMSIEVADDAGNVFISESINVRVNLTLDINQDPTLVFGQIEGAAASYYGNAFMDENGIWLSDYSDAALYFYNDIPSESTAEPDQIITTIEYNDLQTQEIESQSIDGSQTPFVYNNQLFVASYNNSAVYIYDGIPVEGEDNFGIVLGFDDFGASSEEDSCSAARLDSPEAVLAVDDRLLVVDAGNSRVLIWNSIPTQSGTLPDIVLGQFSFDSCDSDSEVGDDTTEFLVNYPSGVWSDGTKVLVVDGNNNRVLGWNNFPTSNGQAADFVLGQATLFDDDCNQGFDQATASTLCNNYEGVFSNGRQIFVADSSRVLVWNDWPTSSGVAADIVLGQPDFTNNAEQDVDKIEGNQFAHTTGVFVYDNHLLVSEESTGRIVVFNGQ